MSEKGRACNGQTAAINRQATAAEVCLVQDALCIVKMSSTKSMALVAECLTLYLVLESLS